MGRTTDRSAVTAATNLAPEKPRQPAAEPRAGLGPFLLGTAVGGIAGAIATALLGRATRSLLLGVLHLFGRRFSSAEREELRFELLLQ